MKYILWLLAGAGTAAALAQFAAWRRKGPVDVGGLLDLNSCSREELLDLAGMDDDLADRILDNRPYRSKFDLLNRLVIPENIYSLVRSRVSVKPEAAHKSVQIALV